MGSCIKTFQFLCLLFCLYHIDASADKGKEEAEDTPSIFQFVHGYGCYNMKMIEKTGMKIDWFENVACKGKPVKTSSLNIWRENKNGKDLTCQAFDDSGYRSRCSPKFAAKAINPNRPLVEFDMISRTDADGCKGVQVCSNIASPYGTASINIILTDQSCGNKIKALRVSGEDLPFWDVDNPIKRMNRMKVLDAPSVKKFSLIMVHAEPKPKGGDGPVSGQARYNSFDEEMGMNRFDQDTQQTDNSAESTKKFDMFMVGVIGDAITDALDMVGKTEAEVVGLGRAVVAEGKENALNNAYKTHKCNEDTHFCAGKTDAESVCLPKGIFSYMRSKAADSINADPWADDTRLEEWTTKGKCVQTKRERSASMELRNEAARPPRYAHASVYALAAASIYASSALATRHG